MGVDISYFIVPLSFSRVVPHMGILLVDQVSIALLSDQIFRPLVTVWESVKTQTEGFFFSHCLDVLSLVRKHNSAHRADLQYVSFHCWS